MKLKPKIRKPPLESLRAQFTEIACQFSTLENAPIRTVFDSLETRTKRYLRMVATSAIRADDIPVVILAEMVQGMIDLRSGVCRLLK